MLQTPLPLPASPHPQTYFLTATDARGRRLRYDHVVRLERFEEDLREVARSLGVAERELPTFVRRHNANHVGTVDVYAAALRNSSRAICTICEILAIDYACLHYRPPPECERCSVEAAGAPELVGGAAGARRRASARWAAGRPTDSVSEATRCDRAPDSCRFV